MLDLIVNAVTSAFAASNAPGPRRRKRTVAEELVWTLAVLVFPFVDFILVLELGVRAAILLPILFTMTTLLLAARLGNTTLTTLATVICLVFSAAASFFGVLLAGGGFFGF